jgi:hypothetical protein
LAQRLTVVQFSPLAIDHHVAIFLRFSILGGDFDVQIVSIERGVILVAGIQFGVASDAPFPLFLAKTGSALSDVRVTLK